MWIGSSRADIRQLSEDVQHVLGRALLAVQVGGTPQESKPLHGPLAGVHELRANDVAGTYRAVYTHRFEGIVYVLHVFQKKSPSGARMSRHDADLILRRLALARLMHAEHTKGRGEDE